MAEICTTELPLYNIKLRLILFLSFIPRFDIDFTLISDAMFSNVNNFVA